MKAATIAKCRAVIFTARQTINPGSRDVSREGSDIFGAPPRFCVAPGRFDLRPPGIAKDRLLLAEKADRRMEIA
jgi:hypothetical protein